MRLLLVEDHKPLADWLMLTLQRNNYSVDCVHDGADADHLLLTQQYDLIILDIALPKLNGNEVVKRLRARNNAVPVLMLTAANSVQGRVLSLDLGADDYMGKPFEVSELEARIRALLRRSGQRPNPVWQCGSLIYDSNTRIFTVAELPLSVTGREHAILEILMLKAGKTVSKKMLAESLFSMEDESSFDAIEVYIHRLRKKLSDCDASIITLRGLGYLLKHHHAIQ
ncbi:response regulator [Herbaspirillum lusitanum]|uniref:response regulator n=1 Tax=Herbaspirillum lusitanum TaxID=213312 RepID=UPI000373CBB2|nr:response regulator [Herbaspirillum lusitanum]MCW5299410.1 DNA-binding response regulator [Herbaspirillum lusitanum]